MSGTLTSKGLAEALGVTVRNVRAWTRKGCPHAIAGIGTRGGKRSHLFDLLEVKAWLIARGIAPKETAENANESAKAAPVIAVGSQINDPGYDGMQSRTEYAERLAFAYWAQSVREQKSSAESAARARVWGDLVDLQRKVSKDQAAVLRQQGSVVPVEDARNALIELATEVRTALLSLPRSIAPTLQGLSAAEVEQALQKEIDGVLSTLSREVRTE